MSIVAYPLHEMRHKERRYICEYLSDRSTQLDSHYHTLLPAKPSDTFHSEPPSPKAASNGCSSAVRSILRSMLR